MPEAFYERKTPSLESPGEKSIDLDTELASGDYGDAAGDVIIKAIWVGAAGDIKGYKLRDDLTGAPGTARTWAVPAGTYLLGPFAQIQSVANGTTATGLVGEYF